MTPVYAAITAFDSRLARPRGTRRRTATVFHLAFVAVLGSGCANVLGLADDAHLDPSIGDDGGAGGQREDQGAPSGSTAKNTVSTVVSVASSTVSTASEAASTSTTSGGPTSCTKSEDCASDQYCSLFTCQPKKQDNVPCGSGDECISDKCKGFVCQS